MSAINDEFITKMDRNGGRTWKASTIASLFLGSAPEVNGPRLGEVFQMCSEGVINIGV
jgi:hypothetical protein